MYKRLKKIKKLLPLYIMALPALVYLFINNYLPLTGMVVAFKDFDYSKGIYGSDWAGFRNFLFLFKNSVAFIITRNTILYNVVFIIINTFLGILVAILLSEVTSKKALKVYQTVILLPYLFSIVIISYLVFAFLSTDVGFINKGILEPLGKSTISWYNESIHGSHLDFRQLFIMPMLFLLISLTMKRLNWMGHQSFNRYGISHWYC